MACTTDLIISFPNEMHAGMMMYDALGVVRRRSAPADDGQFFRLPTARTSNTVP